MNGLKYQLMGLGRDWGGLIQASHMGLSVTDVNSLTNSAPL